MSGELEGMWLTAGLLVILVLIEYFAVRDNQGTESWSFG